MTLRDDAAKPVWIIDDDRSIRWVFEKALTREGIDERRIAGEARDLLAIDDREVAQAGHGRQPCTHGEDRIERYCPRRGRPPCTLSCRRDRDVPAARVCAARDVCRTA